MPIGKKQQIQDLQEAVRALKERIAHLETDKFSGQKDLEKALKRNEEKINLILDHLGLEYCEGHERSRTWQIEPQLRTKSNRRGRPKKTNIKNCEPF